MRTGAPCINSVFTPDIQKRLRVDKGRGSEDGAGAGKGAGNKSWLTLSLVWISLAMPPISLFLKSRRQLCLPMGSRAWDLVPQGKGF